MKSKKTLLLLAFFLMFVAFSIFRSQDNERTLNTDNGVTKTKLAGNTDSLRLKENDQKHHLKEVLTDSNGQPRPSSELSQANRNRLAQARSEKLRSELSRKDLPEMAPVPALMSESLASNKKEEREPLAENTSMSEQDILNIALKEEKIINQKKIDSWDSHFKMKFLYFEERVSFLAMTKMKGKVSDTRRVMGDLAYIVYKSGDVTFLGTTRYPEKIKSFQNPHSLARAPSEKSAPGKISFVISIPEESIGNDMVIRFYKIGSLLPHSSELSIDQVDQIISQGRFLNEVPLETSLSNI